MKILAIETSCDDTCIAILKTKENKFFHFKILSNIVSSQTKVHRKWGGVYPTLAKREHQKNLVTVLSRALKEAKLLKKTQSEKFKLRIQNLEKILEREETLLKQSENFLKKYQKPDVDLIAVTTGPGLEPCLWVGVNFAKALSYFWNLPIIPVNHIEAHIIANFVGKSQISLIAKQLPTVHTQQGAKRPICNLKSQILPAICLVVSGGHTQLILMKNFGEYKILGEIRDDAAGECFDKVAKILGLGYPGGPIVAAEAAKCSRPHPVYNIRLPRPMIHQKNYDFSFSGLKTAVLYDFKSRPSKIRKSKQYIQEICAETQQAIIDVLIHKTLKATKNFGAKTIILGGGVVANQELRKQFKNTIEKNLPKIYYLKPKTYLSTDNAAMVGAAAYYHWLKGETKNWKEIKVNANLRIA